MSNEVAVRPNNTLLVYDRVADPVVFSNEMAKAAASMLNAPLDQGVAIAMTALCEGITLLEMRRRYHWIQGKPTMRADAMLAEFRLNHGGEYEILERTPNKVAIAFDHRDSRTECSLQWEGGDEPVSESRWPWKDWQDHSKGLKDNWATPTDRKAMMFARLVSESLRAICPELVAGVYTPEEIQDTPAMDRPAPPTIESMVKQGSVIESVVVPDEKPDPASPGSITKRHLELIPRLFDALSLTPEKRAEILAKRGASVVHNLSHDDAGQIVDRLNAIIAQQDAQAGE